MFVPIGNYMLLENGIQNLLDSSNVSAQVQELVLKEPLRKVTNISAITGGHSIASYAKNLTKLAMAKGVRLDVQQDSFFLPTVEGRASIVWTEMNDHSWRCRWLLGANSFNPYKWLQRRRISPDCPLNQLPNV